MIALIHNLQDLSSNWCTFLDMKINRLMIREREALSRDWDYQMVIEEVIQFLAGGFIL